MSTPISVCFMVMPFGKKLTHAGTDTIPVEVDFDLLWDKVFRPMIVEDLDLTPIRADQDAGSLIIQAMIERLVISDVVIADMTIPNANVYYEVGVRHAAKREGCVLVAADWSKPMFDVSQMRRVKFPLTEGTITDETAAAIRKALVPGVKGSLDNVAPVFQALPGFPDHIEKEQLESFREVAGKLSEFQAKVGVARGLPPELAAAMATELIDEYKSYAMAAPSMALDLVHLLRDGLNMDQGLQFIGDLPKRVRSLPAIREQRALMLGKSGQATQAIIELESLIRTEGDTSERSGLLGGRYKGLYNQAIEEEEKSGFLNKAIACYERATMLDLNDYYPASNLPRLYRARKLAGDEKKAASAANLAQMASERAHKRNPADVWATLTLLGAAFDAGDVPSLQKMLAEMGESVPSHFHLKSTLPDLRRSLLLNDDPQTSAALATALAVFQRWLDPQGTVVAMAGRRIDAEGAEERRFPPGNESAVAQRIRNLLVGTACQAVVSAAACGADILLLESAGKLGLKRRVVLPFARDRFRTTSVADRGEAWGERFDAILNQLASSDVVDMKLTGDNNEAYVQANARIVEEALTLGAATRRYALAMVVWNGFTRGTTDLTDDFRKVALGRGLESISVPTL